MVGEREHNNGTWVQKSATALPQFASFVSMERLPSWPPSLRRFYDPRRSLTGDCAAVRL